MLQIVKCSDVTCCKPWKTNYCEFHPQRFLPPPVPVAISENGLRIDRENGAFRSLFQALYLSNALELNICYDEYCPSLQVKGTKYKTIIERRTCPQCNLYHSTITALKKRKRECKNGWQQQTEFIPSPEVSDESEAEVDERLTIDDLTTTGANIFERIDKMSGMS